MDVALLPTNSNSQIYRNHLYSQIIYIYTTHSRSICVHTCRHKSSLRRIACITHMHCRRKRREKREISENIKCLQASRKEGGWRLLSEAICYAPAVLLFFHLSSYVSIPSFFSPFSLSLSFHVCQHVVSTSAFCFCVCDFVFIHLFVCACILVCGCGW